MATTDRGRAGVGGAEGQTGDRRAWGMPAWLPIAAILAVALALRLWGVPYGLPNLYNWDEPTVVNRAVRFGGGDLNPHFFYYPTLWMYLLAIVFGGYFAVGRLSGHFHSASDFVVEYLAHPTSTYLIARVATALAGVATVWLVYRIGMRLMGREVGILAAALLSVSVIHVAYSQQVIDYMPTNGKLGAVRARVTRVLSSRGVYRETPFDAPGWPGADYVLVSSGCGPLSAAARASLEGRLAARFGPDPARLAAMPSGARAVLDLPPTISIYRWTGSGARGRVAAP